jgi:uncharacterized glyoxalase superfamily protein PhnB
MAVCIPFIRVHDIAETIQWYERIGFTCTGTNRIWEPDCELNWAELNLDGATFMLYPDPSPSKSASKCAGLYFRMEAIDEMPEKLKRNAADIIEITEETFYGRKEVVFLDLNGFQVTFSCEPDKK